MGVTEVLKEINTNDLDVLSDEELLSLCIKNSAYFGQIIKRYENKLSHYIRRSSSTSNEDIQDLLQEIFLKVYLNLNGFDTNLKFSSWIYRISHNEMISWYRKKKIRPQINFEDYEETNFQELIKDDDNVEQNFANSEIKTKIHKAINLLEEKYKDIIILRFIEEKEYEEISDILQIPVGTVSTLLYRGKKQLQKLLEKNI